MFLSILSTSQNNSMGCFYLFIYHHPKCDSCNLFTFLIPYASSWGSSRCILSQIQNIFRNSFTIYGWAKELESSTGVIPEPTTFKFLYLTHSISELPTTPHFFCFPQHFYEEDFSNYLMLFVCCFFSFVLWSMPISYKLFQCWSVHHLLNHSHSLLVRNYFCNMLKTKIKNKINFL